jgi:hypothetical protein
MIGHHDVLDHAGDDLDRQARFGVVGLVIDEAAPDLGGEENPDRRRGGMIDRVSAIEVPIRRGDNRLVDAILRAVRH